MPHARGWPTREIYDPSQEVEVQTAQALCVVRKAVKTASSRTVQAMRYASSPEREPVKSTTKTFSMPPELAKAVVEKAAELGVSESVIARWALAKYLNLRTIDVSIGRPNRKGKKS